MVLTSLSRDISYGNNEIHSGARLVTQLLVHDPEEGLAHADAAQVLTEAVEVTGRTQLAGPGGVRSHDDILERPQRMVGRQRLERGDIERGAAAAAGLPGTHQRLAVDDLPSGDVDQERPPLH